MASFYIHNFGCRATQADAAAIRDGLLARGYRSQDSASRANLVVLNTCTVTAAADSEARETIRHIHRANPQARIIVTGCYAQRAPEELAGLDGVSLVVGNSHLSEIPDLAGAPADFVPLAQLGRFNAPLAPIFRGAIREQFELSHLPSEDPAAERTRPTLKIQDGCNHRCAYCVIPSVRGKSRSLPPQLVISEIRRLVREGAREIVLSGIDLGSYGGTLNPRGNLQSVIRQILAETSLERLRISSIEPMDVTRDFAELVASSERIAPHFHMPLQSGSDRILGAMHRWYRAEHYARRVEIIRNVMPHAAIGADVIAGFPGETNEDHWLTAKFLEKLPLSYLHVFSFSPRPGTEGASLAENYSVPLEVIHRRARELRSVAVEKASAFRAAQMGQNVRVLTLGHANPTQPKDWTDALSGNYLKVRVAGRWPRNQWLDVVFAAGEEPLPATPSPN